MKASEIVLGEKYAFRNGVRGDPVMGIVLDFGWITGYRRGVFIEAHGKPKSMLAVAFPRGGGEWNPSVAKLMDVIGPWESVKALNEEGRKRIQKDREESNARLTALKQRKIVALDGLRRHGFLNAEDHAHFQMLAGIGSDARLDLPLEVVEAIVTELNLNDSRGRPE